MDVNRNIKLYTDIPLNADCSTRFFRMGEVPGLPALLFSCKTVELVGLILSGVH